MPTPTFKTETAKEMHVHFERLVARGESLDVIFTDFLELTICHLSGQTRIHEILTLMKKWRVQEGETFKESAFYEFDQALNTFLVGMKQERGDIIGDYFESAGLGDRGLGQVFTPDDLVDFVIALTGVSDAPVFDPCCGSGRFLLSASSLRPGAMLYGVDIDRRMAQMCAINLALHGLRGMVINGDIFGIQPGPLSESEFECAYDVGFPPPFVIREVT